MRSLTLPYHCGNVWSIVPLARFAATLSPEKPCSWWQTASLIAPMPFEYLTCARNTQLNMSRRRLSDGDVWSPGTSPAGFVR